MAPAWYECEAELSSQQNHLKDSNFSRRGFFVAWKLSPVCSQPLLQLLSVNEGEEVELER